MKDSDMPRGKFSRAWKTGAIATKSGVKHLGYLGAKTFSKQPEKLKQEHEKALGKILFNGLSQMRGTALKMSQLLSLENGIIPEGIREELAKGCYSVPPINRAHIRKVFLQEFNCEANTLFARFEHRAFAAASLGQVHRATLAQGQAAAVKIQYPGIQESIHSDLKLLSTLIKALSVAGNGLPKTSVLDTTINEIRACLLDEIDYQKEASNTQWFRQHLTKLGVQVPEVYSEFSSSRILTTQYLHGEHIDTWLARQPSQAERNTVGQKLFDTFLYCAFELHALHADPHMGNYLLLENNKLAMLDFGCIKKLQASYINNYQQFMQAILTNNSQGIFSAYKRFQLIAETLSFTEFEKALQPALAPLQHWVSLPFQTHRYDFSTLPLPPVEQNQQHKQAIQYFNDIQRDQMYFDRTLFGVYQLLKKIGAVVNTKNAWLGR